MKNSKCLTKEQQKIVEDNINLVYKFYTTYGKKYYNFEYDDIIQILSIGLIKAVKAYDETKGLFSTLAYTCMRNELNMALRSVDKYNKLNVIASLDDIIPNANHDDVFTLADIIPCIENVLDYKQIMVSIEQVCNKLSSKHKRVVYDYIFNGLSQKQISNKYKISQPQVSRIMKKFKDLLKENQ